MNMYTGAVAAALILLGGSASATRLAGYFADGTWDCYDEAMTGVGAIVLAGTAYAYIAADGSLAGRGTLHQMGNEIQDWPHFAVLGGYLRDRFGANGLTTEGPRGHADDMSGEVFLVIFVSDDEKNFCRRRDAPDM